MGCLVVLHYDLIFMSLVTNQGVSYDLLLIEDQLWNPGLLSEDGTVCYMTPLEKFIMIYPLIFQFLFNNYPFNYYVAQGLKVFFVCFDGDFINTKHIRKS